MTDHGTLGAFAVQKLAAIKAARARLDQEETQTLALVAEAQGYQPNGPVRFDYNLDMQTWRAVIPPPAEAAV